MNRYRRVYTRLWSHPDLRALEPLDKLLAIYLLTNNQSNRIGLYRFSLALAAEELALPPESLGDRLSRVLRAFNWHYDARAGVVWIPSWLDWNQPDNPNVLKGVIRDLEDVPRTELIDRFAQEVLRFPAAWHEPFRKGIAKVRRTSPD